MEAGRMMEGKRVVVSGGAQGMGRAIVLLMAAQGAVVAFSDVDDAYAIQTLADARELSPESFYLHADMGDAADVTNFVREVLRLFGHCDVLVNVVGINQRQPAVEMEMAVYNRLLDVNLKSVMRLSRAFVPGMAAAGGGAIVNISSVHAHATMTGFSAYAATKGGLDAMTRVMAIDCGPMSIRVNSVCPGAIYTSEMRPWWEGKTGIPLDYPSLLAHQPMTGPGLATDVAHTVLFLASDNAGYITGATLRLDGGTSLQAHRVEQFPEPEDYEAQTEAHRVRLDASCGGGP